MASGILKFLIAATSIILVQSVAAKPPGGAADDFLDLLRSIEEKAGFKAVEFDLKFNPPVGPADYYEVLPWVSGRVYSGHLQGLFTPNTGNEISLICGDSSAWGGSGFYIIKQSNDQLLFERDFSCSFLTINFYDFDDESGGGSTQGIVTYSYTDDVEIQEYGDP
jgi:hypothetical protein